MSVEEFRNYNDHDYLRGVGDHHRGYVLNIQRTYNPRAVMTATEAKTQALLEAGFPR